MELVDKGFIYLIQEDFSSTYKIGKTKNLDSRLDFFSLTLPFNIELIHVIFSKNYHQTEKLLHQYFAEKRLNGEWFCLDDNDIRNIRLGEFIDENINNSIKGVYIPSVSFDKLHSILYEKIDEIYQSELTDSKNKEAQAMKREEEKLKNKQIRELKKMEEEEFKKQNLLMEKEKLTNALKLTVLNTGETRVTKLQKILNLRTETISELMTQLIDLGWIVKHKSKALGYELRLTVEKRQELLDQMQLVAD